MLRGIINVITGCYLVAYMVLQPTVYHGGYALFEVRETVSSTGWQQRTERERHNFEPDATSRALAQKSAGYTLSEAEAALSPVFQHLCDLLLRLIRVYNHV